MGIELIPDIASIGNEGVSSETIGFVWNALSSFKREKRVTYLRHRIII